MVLTYLFKNLMRCVIFYRATKITLLLFQANRMSKESSVSSKSEIMPSPEKSESLPKTHNRVEAKHSLPAKLGSPTPKSQSTRQRSQTAQPSTTGLLIKDKSASPKNRPIRGECESKSAVY